MIPDLQPIFAEYEKLRASCDAVFERIRHGHAQCVTCKEGCSDCCHALFDLSLVEAMYINRAFQQAFDYGPQRSAILTRAAETDRQLTRLKRELFREEKSGKSPEAIMEEAARIKCRCPLLGDDDRCLLYQARPITCRLYGVPTAIAGQGHVCGFAAFEKGKSYPTVYLDKPGRPEPRDRPHRQQPLPRAARSLRAALHGTHHQLRRGLPGHRPGQA